MWVEVPHPSISYGVFRSLWYCSRVTYAQFMEDGGQLYGDMAGRYRWGHD